VIEVAIDGVQSSTRYRGGVALRFARVKRYRPTTNRQRPTRSTHCEPSRRAATGHRMPLRCTSWARGHKTGTDSFAAVEIRPPGSGDGTSLAFSFRGTEEKRQASGGRPPSPLTLNGARRTRDSLSRTCADRRSRGSASRYLPTEARCSVSRRVESSCSPWGFAIPRSTAPSCARRRARVTDRLL
jgi:hypothetical protein